MLIDNTNNDRACDRGENLKIPRGGIRFNEEGPPC